MKENINFVAKYMNPPNVPQTRQIENLWGDLVHRLYNNGWEAQKSSNYQYGLKMLQRFDRFRFTCPYMEGVKKN
jgi:hypothetical protein